MDTLNRYTGEILDRTKARSGQILGKLNKKGRAKEVR
jgi:hypothetical protein